MWVHVRYGMGWTDAVILADGSWLRGEQLLLPLLAQQNDEFLKIQNTSSTSIPTLRLVLLSSLQKLNEWKQLLVSKWQLPDSPSTHVEMYRVR